MNELLGTLIPLLMSGYGLSDILRIFGGASSASAMDGLQGMMRSQAINARIASPLVQNQSTINAAAEKLVGKFMNPYTDIGQGVTSLMGHLYHVAPDTMGTILGVPYGGQFFSTIANGAAGINQAAGLGGVDIFNPYSVLAAHQNTGNMARMMYDFGVRKDGGYDVSYGHGLNMGEMGKVAQRILSSQIPYMDDDGRRLDLSRDEKGNYINGSDAEKFSSNLKKLGSKFNEAVSSMSKLTGSVDDALRVMDQMAGGNFLGGSVEQAKSVAERARRLAATIRVTSAIAGTSPMEAFANMQGLAQTMAGATGMSNYIAGSSGYSSMMGTMAASATAAYGMWAAMNPDASQVQKAQALLAANGRATRYASENGSAFSAMIADNMHLFSEKDIREIETANREGHPNTVADLVRRRIGADMYSRYMTDPAFQIAARHRVSMPGNDDRAEVLRRLDSAGMQGGLEQAETEGNKRLMESMIGDLDTDLSTISGRGGQSLRNERNNVVLGRLRRMAGRYGLDQKASMKMGEDELVGFLESRPGMDMRRLGRIVNSAKIEAAEQQIDRMTMTGSEDSHARSRALSAINSSGYYSAEGKRELSERIRSGEDIDAVLRDFTKPMKPNEARKVMEGVTRGKLTSEQAKAMKSRFSDMKETQQVDATTRERIGSIREEVRRSEVSDAGLLKGYMASEGFGDMAGKFALEKFSGTVNELLASGQVSTGGDDKDLTNTYDAAAKRMLSKIIGPSLGNMSGKDLNNMLDRASKDVVIGIRAGKDMGKTLSESLGSLSDEQRKAIGEEGIKRLDKIIGDAENEDSKLVRTQLNIGSLLDESKNVISEKTREAGIYKMDADAFNRLRLDASRIGVQSGRATDAEKVGVHAELAVQGGVSGETYVNAWERAVEEMVGENVSDTSLAGLTPEQAKEARQKISRIMNEGISDENKTSQQAFSDAVKKVKEEYKGKLSDEGEGLGRIADAAVAEGSAVNQSLGVGNLLGKTSTIIQTESGKSMDELRTAAREIGESKSVTDQSALQRLKDVSSSKYGISGETYDAARSRAVEEMVGENVSDTSLAGLTPEQAKEARQKISRIMNEGISDENKTSQQAFSDAVKKVKEEYKGKLSDEGEGLGRIADSAVAEGSAVNQSLGVGNLLGKTSVNMANASGIDKVQSAAESLGQKGVKDDKTAVLSFREKIRDIGKNGRISFKVDDKTLSDMFSKGGTRMVMDVLGGEGKRLGNLDGKELEKLSSAVNENMMSFVNSENVSFDEGFVRALGRLTPEQRASIGKDGMEQVQKLIDQQKEGGIEGISSRNYFSSVVGVADEMDKKGRMASVDRMDEILKGNFGKKNAGEATKELMDLSRNLGILKGDEKGDRKMVTDAVRNFVSESFGAYGISKKDEEAIVNSAGKMFKGDYRSAIKAAAMERGRKTGNSRLMSLAKAVGERDDVNTSILGNVLKSIRPDAGRKPSFAAIAQSGSADLAGLNMAAVSAAVTGMDMGEVLLNQYAPDLLSGTDDAASDAMMNRIPNALKVGGNTFAKNAVAKTKKQMVDLGKALRNNGIDSADALKLALSEGDSEEAKTARASLSKAIGGMDTAEGKKNLNLLRTINEGAKIGGKSAFEVMMGGDSAFKSIGKSKAADADVLNITRESNRRDSDAYKIMDKIGGLVKGMSSYFDNHLIKVTVVDGKIDTSGSKNKVVTL